MFAIEYGGEEELWRDEARCRDGLSSCPIENNLCSPEVKGHG